MAHQITIRTVKRSGLESCSDFWPSFSGSPAAHTARTAWRPGPEAGVKAVTARDPRFPRPGGCQRGRRLLRQTSLLLGAWLVSSLQTVYRGLLLSLSILSKEQRELMLVVKTIMLSRELLGIYGNFRTTSRDVGDFQRCFPDLVRIRGSVCKWWCGEERTHIVTGLAPGFTE